jgi:biopolymer transport protein ExbD
MASAVGTGKKGVNIDLNIIPFVDVMSCLTAFLLVTAVWTGVAQERTGVAGRCAPGAQCDPDPDARWLAVLVESERTSVLVMPHGDVRELATNDWAGVGDALRALAPHANSGVQIAVESTRAHPLSYQTLVLAMDTAVKAGFPDVSVTDAGNIVR